MSWGRMCVEWNRFKSNQAQEATTNWKYGWMSSVDLVRPIPESVLTGIGFLEGIPTTEVWLLSPSTKIQAGVKNILYSWKLKLQWVSLGGKVNNIGLSSREIQLDHLRSLPPVSWVPVFWIQLLLFPPRLSLSLFDSVSLLSIFLYSFLLFSLSLLISFLCHNAEWKIAKPWSLALSLPRVCLSILLRHYILPSMILAYLWEPRFLCHDGFQAGPLHMLYLSQLHWTRVSSKFP